LREEPSEEEAAALAAEAFFEPEAAESRRERDEQAPDEATPAAKT
jgi:hypothetical protein